MGQCDLVLFAATLLLLPGLLCAGGEVRCELLTVVEGVQEGGKSLSRDTCPTSSKILAAVCAVRVVWPCTLEM